MRTFPLQGYPFPLSITMIHLITKFLLAWVVRKLWSLCTGRPPLVLGWRENLWNIVPVGMCVRILNHRMIYIIYD